MPKCNAKTKSGKPCKNPAQEGSEYCHVKSHQEQSLESGLTDKQKAFVIQYCVDYNATQAAIRAGYSKKTASEQGYQLLHNTSVSGAIQKRMDDLSMTAAEAVKRMTDWGRGTAENFLTVDPDTRELIIDISSDEAKQSLHLIKKLKQNDTIIQKAKEDGTPEVIGRTWEIELHDAKDAVDKILKIHGAYVENINMSVKREEYDPVNGDPEEYLARRLGGK